MGCLTLRPYQAEANMGIVFHGCSTGPGSDERSGVAVLVSARLNKSIVGPWNVKMFHAVPSIVMSLLDAGEVARVLRNLRMVAK